MDSAKELWEEYGANDAYYAVVTFDKFRKGKLDEAARAEFFQMGTEHVDRIAAELEKGFGPPFAPKRALDYGCGVGRILLPLARRSTSAVGVDISHAMLDEAGRNAREMGLENVELQDASGFAAADSESYDFVHSFIVLQHIDPSTGLQIITKMVDRLEPNGLGMIHVTYHHPIARSKKLRFRLYRDMPFLHRILNVVRGRRERLIPVYEYDLNVVFRLLQERGCGECFVRFSSHAMLGAMIFFRKAETQAY